MKMHLALGCLTLVLATTGQAAFGGPVVDNRPVVKTVVSRKVMQRLRSAREAIAFVKRAIPKQGNMVDTVRETKGNAARRMMYARLVTQPSYNLATAAAAAVACSRGGACSEHAQLAKHYLEIQDVEPEIYTAKVRDEDHAFVWIGAKDDPDDEVVIVDPWVMNPEPVLWKDFWVHDDRRKVVFREGKLGGKELRADRRELVKQIKAGFGDQRQWLAAQVATVGQITAQGFALWEQAFAAPLVKREFVLAPKKKAVKAAKK